MNLFFRKILFSLLIILIPFISIGQDDDSTSISKPKKKGLFSFFKRNKEKEGSYEPGEKVAKKKFNWKFWENIKEKKGLILPEEEQSQFEGQDLTDKERDYVEKLIEKYKLNDDEKEVRAMWESGEPLNRKGKKVLKKADKKMSKFIYKIRWFHIKRNYNIQTKEVKKRMKKHRKEANKRMKK